MKNIVYLFAFAFSILSCTNDIKKNNPAMQAKVNDVVWRATDARITPNEEGGITITALTLNETITLNTNSNEPGTYIFGSTNQDNYVTYDLSISGVLSSFETSSFISSHLSRPNLSIINSSTALFTIPYITIFVLRF